jgi:hypothetical protein
MLIKKKKIFIPLTIVLFIVLSMGENFFLYKWIWKFLSFQRVPARFFFLSFIGITCAAAFFWNSALSKKNAAVKIALFLFVFLDLFLNGKHFIWTEDWVSKVQKTESIKWLQIQLANNRSSRIFTREDIGFPNKTMFYGLYNVNGYEAILQRSLLNFFLQTQKNSNITTTGVDMNRYASKAATLFSTKYVITTDGSTSDIPIAINYGTLKIYQNPEPFPIASPFFALKNFSNSARLFSFLNSASYNSIEMITAVNKPPLDEQILRLPRKNVACSNYKRKSCNGFEMEWICQEPSQFWIFLSEAYYPGWRAWAENGKKYSPFETNGYFQSILIKQDKIPSQKLFWLFDPTDQKIGLILSSISIFVLVSAGFFSLLSIKKLFLNSPF